MKDFSSILEQARPGDLVLVRHEGPNDILSDGIEWFSDGTVSHCFICLGDGAIVEAVPLGGVKIQQMSMYFKDGYSLILRRIGAPYSVIYSNTGARIAEAAKGLVGSRYDFSQIAIDAVYFLLGKIGAYKLQGRVARRWKGWRGGYTCSELYCTAVWKGVGVELFPGVEYGLIPPQKLLESSVLLTLCRI